MNNPVYTPVEEIKIPSSHGKDINYIVGYGYVDWKKKSDLRPAVYVMMEYGGVRNYHLVSHITTDKNDNGKSDFEMVMEQIELFKQKYNL